MGALILDDWGKAEGEGFPPGLILSRTDRNVLRRIKTG